jgi:hypothetical protein
LVAAAEPRITPGLLRPLAVLVVAALTLAAAVALIPVLELPVRATRVEMVSRGVFKSAAAAAALLALVLTDL